jgi:NADH:ubiquinone oxidoreductase subunit 6 (subunit J)
MIVMFIEGFYYVGIGLAGLGALFLLQTHKEIYAILGFLWVTVCLSGLYFLQGASFIAGMQIIIQGGGVLVWLLSSMWFKKTLPTSYSKSVRAMHWLLFGLVMAGTTLLGYFVAQHFASLPATTATRNLATTSTLGFELLGTYGIAFEWVGLIVLLALVLVVDWVSNLKK